MDGSSELVASSMDPDCAVKSPLNLATKSMSDRERRDGDIDVLTAEWMCEVALRGVEPPSAIAPMKDLERKDPSSSL